MCCFGNRTVLWDVYGECRNFGELRGHKNAVLEVQWTYDSAQVVSASADKTVGVWDAQVHDPQAPPPPQMLGRRCSLTRSWTSRLDSASRSSRATRGSSTVAVP